MLICKKCSAECSDTAKFCHICGERIDGKKRCDACGAWNEQDAIFCPSCGARVDGKTVCSACGTLFEGNFCPECGKAVKQAKTANFQAEKTQKPRGTVGEKVKSISELVSGACVALGALFALIFVFFIGVEVSVLGSSLGDLGLSGIGTKLNLYYFFGEAHDLVELQSITGELGTIERWVQLMSQKALKEHAIAGTVVSVLILLVVAGTAITALTLYVLNWLKITKKSSYGWGMAAIMSFIGSVVLFANLNSLSMNMLKNTEAVSLVWTGATTAGFVLCAVFGGLAVVAKVLAQGSAPWKRDGIVKTALSLAGVVLVCVWLGAVGGLGKQIQLFVTSASDSTSMSINMEVKLGFILFSSFFIGVLPYDAMAADKELIKSKVSTVATMSVICQILSIVLIVLAVVVLFIHIKNAHKDQQQSKTVFIVTIIMWVLSLALCILCSISVDKIKDCSEMVQDYLVNGMTFLHPRAAKYMGYNVAFTMVMSSVYLVYEIGKKVLKSLSKAKENA